MQGGILLLYRGAMMKSNEQRAKLRKEIADSIISSKEALEILGFSRMRLNQIVNDGRITPIRSGIYLKDDILAFNKSRETSAEKE